MNILTYLLVFIFKIIEDALATLRLIVVSNGKKKLGAFLQFIVTLIWIILTGTVLYNLQKDIFKAIAFALGSFFGSYCGSVLEEKIALGTNIFMVEVNNDDANDIIKNLKDYEIFKILNNNKTFLIITCPRKENDKILFTIKNINKNAFILSEKVKTFL